MHFTLRVLDSQGSISMLPIEAQNQADAEMLANNLGYSVLSISRQIHLNLDWLNRKTPFDILLFSQELLALLKAGLSLLTSIETLAEKSLAGETQTVLQGIRNSLHQGQSFATGLQDFPQAFPMLFVAMVRASERTGDLNHALARYILYRTQLEQVRSKVINASIYPVVLIVVGSLVTLFLLGYVVPKFSSIYESTGRDLPLLSTLLMKWGLLLHEHGKNVAIVGLGLFALLVYGLSRKSLQRQLVKVLWRIPSIGERVRIYQLARFYRTLGMLLQGGIPLVTAMQMSADLLGEALRLQLLLAMQQVREGLPLSTALEQQGLSTPVSKRMMAVGEQTGNMGEMMENAASFYDQEISRAVEWATRLIEPLLMALIGLFIGAIVILMYLPIFELADTIQ